MSIFSFIRKFKSDRKGNVAAIFALALVPIMLSVGASVDYSLAQKMRGKISHSIDAALLAASSAVIENVDLNDTKAVEAMLDKEFEPYFLANVEGEPGFHYKGAKIKFDPKTKSVTASVEMVYETLFYKMAGLNTLEENVKSRINLYQDAGGAMSMYLVLDRSGSMNGGGRPSRIASLKVAVASMIKEFKIADPDEEFLRMGMVAYDRRISAAPVPSWKLDETNARVQALRARGGTDSSEAMFRAYSHLKSPTEIAEHKSKHDLDPALIIVLMTDGSNNSRRFDTATLRTCKQAKDYGMEIFTVAFQAPNNGRALLRECASDTAHYFTPDNTAELIQAFKRIGSSTARKLHLSW